MLDKAILKNIPKQPGIYQFFNAAGDIIYIGKSVNLHSRVSSYFNEKATLNFAKKKMVKLVVDIKTIVVNNETESLILETTLIKQHSPKYNILMKDDKNHIYIKITSAEYPKIIKTRIAPKAGISKYNKNYFGPYISTYYTGNILKILKKYFGYGIANQHFFSSKQSYNLDKYLFEGNTKHSNEAQVKKLYLKKIEEMRKFLNGDFSDIIQDLESRMSSYAKNLQFEQAGETKKYLESIESLKTTQVVRDGIKGNFDIVNYIDKYNKCYLGLIKIRDSKIIGYFNFEVENKLDEDKYSIISQFISSRYAENISEENKVSYLVPDKINTGLNDIDNLIENPKAGAKHDLLKLCYKNIYEYAHKKHLDSLSTKSFTKKNMLNLLEIVGYEPVNKKEVIFECNDISHLSGSHTVASRSIINNGKNDSSKYKKFTIKTLPEGKIDDFDSMREIMNRRLKEIEKTNYIPDLIIIDGGKGQLSSVVKVIENYLKTSSKNNDEVGRNLIKNLQIISIAKREEELFKYNDGEFEKFVLEKDTPELRLTQSIRDEAHRFAITFNRDSRIKSMKKNILESIPGIGPKTRKKILTLYGNIDNLKSIDKAELSDKFSKTIITALEDHGII
ncbi:excinuclease ABC subunit UvrC [Candidatus Gracilibacteria bacterium]|nr:excinuclease ABC subunit UvrC [Candidatus Gracilibacteria bacterium]